MNRRIYANNIPDDPESWLSNDVRTWRRWTTALVLALVVVRLVARLAVARQRPRGTSHHLGIQVRQVQLKPYSFRTATTQRGYSKCTCKNAEWSLRSVSCHLNLWGLGIKVACRKCSVGGWTTCKSLMTCHIFRAKFPAPTGMGARARRI
jgi:hypothetical protein